MRYQINAIVNMTLKDADALVRLLVERSEHIEIKALTKDGAPPKSRKGGPRFLRYPRSAMISLGQRSKDMTAGQGEAFDALTKIMKGPMERGKVRALLRDHMGAKGSSASPLITQLLDAGGLRVVE